MFIFMHMLVFMLHRYEYDVGHERGHGHGPGHHLDLGMVGMGMDTDMGTETDKETDTEMETDKDMDTGHDNFFNIAQVFLLKPRAFFFLGIPGNFANGSLTNSDFRGITEIHFHGHLSSR
jgi:hypothetical protein